MDICYLLFLIVAVVFMMSDQTYQCSTEVAGHDYGSQFTSQVGGLLHEPGRNYNNNYYDCWELHSELNGKVKLTFHYFQLQAPENGVCTSDWLKVYDGAEERTEDLMSTYCGSHNGTEVTSSGTKMLVIFSTDESITDIGFQIFYTSVDTKYFDINLFLIISLVVGAAVFAVMALLCVCTKKVNKTADTTPGISLNLYEQEPSPAVMAAGPLPDKT